MQLWYSFCFNNKWSRVSFDWNEYFLSYQVFEQSGSFLNAPNAHPEERSDEGSQE